MLENHLIFPSLFNAVVVRLRVFGVAHNILFGHSAFGSDVCNTRWQIIEDLLDLADSWESFASPCLELVAIRSSRHGSALFLIEQEGRSVVE